MSGGAVEAWAVCGSGGARGTDGFANTKTRSAIGSTGIDTSCCSITRNGVPVVAASDSQRPSGCVGAAVDAEDKHLTSHVLLDRRG